jgi:hypothetical protein
MDDIKLPLGPTMKAPQLRLPYVQLPAHNQQAMPVQNAAPVAPVDTPVVAEKNLHNYKVSNYWNFYRNQSTNLCL